MHGSLSHIVQASNVPPRPVLVRPPGDELTIPIPGTLIAEHRCAGLLYSAEVALWGELHAIVYPTWIEERGHVPA